MKAERAHLALPVVLVLCVLAASVMFYLPAQLFVFETVDYLPHFLGPAPLWKKVFNPFATDLEQVYRARELANLFSFVDAAFLRFCALKGFPHTVSIVHYAGLLAISVLHLRLSRRFMPPGTELPSFILLLLFLFTPAAFVWATYFRTSKMLVALCLALCCWLLVALGRTERASRGGLAALFASAAAMSLSDEQGVFLLALLLGCVFAECLRTGRDNERAAFFALSAGMACRFAYKFVVGPVLIRAATGRAVDLRAGAGASPELLLLAFSIAMAGAVFALALFDAQRRRRVEEAGRALGEAGGGLLLPGALIAAASVLAVLSGYPLWKGLLNLLGTAGLFFGDTGAFGGLCVFGLAAAAVPGRRGLLFSVLFAVAAMNAIMIQKHAAVSFTDVGRIYYPLPASALLLMLGTAVIGDIGARCPSAMKLLSAGLCLLAVSSALAIPGHKKVLMEGFFRRAFDLNPAILECIRRPEVEVGALGLSPGAERHCRIFRPGAAQRG